MGAFTSTILEELKTVLNKDERLVSDNKLLKNRIVELALKSDENLIKLLLSNWTIKEHFFKTVDKILIFDKEKFMKFIDNKEFLPDSYTSFKNKIGLTGDEFYIARSKEVVLSWPYKDCILEGGQDAEDDVRSEIFHNEILAADEIDRLLEPKVFANFKTVDAEGEHKTNAIKPTDNLVIKGNNLLVLHSLKKRFAGRIKLIYIDPPYNTGNDSFKYNDSFNHSAWLTFMKNRLTIAKELLRNDGLIFMSCDDNEQAYLKVLCDEIFDKANFLAQIIVQSNKRGQTYQQIAKTHEYLLVYTKDVTTEINELEAPENKLDYDDEISAFSIRELRNRNPKFGRFNRPNLFYPIFVNPKKIDKDVFSPISLQKSNEYSIEVLPLNSKGKESCWRWQPDTTLDNINSITQKSNLVAKKKNTGKYGIYEKYRKPTVKVKSIWLEKEVISEQGTVEYNKLDLPTDFPFPKPVYLIKKILKLGTEKDSLILDFFAGSGTTGEAVFQLNAEDKGKRKFILVEQLEYTETVTTERLKKAIKKYDGNFTYCELKELNEQYIKKIAKCENTKQLLELWDDMKQHAFLSYKVDPQDFDKNVNDFKNLSFRDQKKLLIECLDKNDLYLNYSEMEDKQFTITKEEIELNKLFYGRS
jgi:adenine-specific DNA-methyltransferase